LTDSFVIGASVPRKVNFVATVQLFRLAPVKWFLTQCGVIPINRAKDNPRAMRSVADTFEACHRVLERGETVGIFPEGITYEDSQLKEIKTGAARMALDLEDKHGGTLGLLIVPVGLTYSAKELYRSDVLAHFGDPIRVAAFLDGYAERRKECITALTREIERRLQELILHIPGLDQVRVVEGVKRLYLERLMVADQAREEALAGRAEELVLSQRIAIAVEHVYRTQPERARGFAHRLARYEHMLRRLRISDEVVAQVSRRESIAAQSTFLAAVAILGAPIAVYGWIHRVIPYTLVRWAIRRFTHPEKRKAQTSTAVIESGIVAFGVCYSAYVAVFHWLVGWPWTLWYALTLPLASILAHYYGRAFGQFRAGVRNVIVFLRAPFVVRRLIRRRAELVREIESVRTEGIAALKK
jgi:1-acyl-sn-glycerol-3-phosphate acyltransferase